MRCRQCGALTAEGRGLYADLRGRNTKQSLLLYFFRVGLRQFSVFLRPMLRIGNGSWKTTTLIGSRCTHRKVFSQGVLINRIHSLLPCVVHKVADRRGLKRGFTRMEILSASICVDICENQRPRVRREVNALIIHMPAYPRGAKAPRGKKHIQNKIFFSDFLVI